MVIAKAPYRRFDNTPKVRRLADLGLNKLKAALAGVYALGVLSGDLMLYSTATEPTAVRSPRGSVTDLRRPSTRPCYTAAAAASLAVSARTSDFQTLRHGVSLSAWHRT